MYKIYIFTEFTKLDDIQEFTNSECDYLIENKFYPNIQYIILTNEQINNDLNKRQYLATQTESTYYYTIHQDNIEIRTTENNEDITYCKFEHFKELSALIMLGTIDLDNDFNKYKYHRKIYTPLNEL
jgi:hypothetical protein